MFCCGATAYGLNNLKSKTQTHQKFANSINEFNGKKVFIMLGEVDVGFLIWLKYQTDKKPLSVYLNSSLNNYYALVDSLTEHYDVYLFSAPLPTIKDNLTLGEVATKRAIIKTTQLERTELTLEFNHQLEKYCNDKMNLKYIDLDEASLGSNGLVRNKLLNQDPSDHHYHIPIFCDLLNEKIKNI